MYTQYSYWLDHVKSPIECFPKMVILKTAASQVKTSASLPRAASSSRDAKAKARSLGELSGRRAPGETWEAGCSYGGIWRYMMI